MSRVFRVAVSLVLVTGCTCSSPPAAPPAQKQDEAVQVSAVTSLEGVPLAGPPDFTLTALDCAGSTVFVAGFAAESKAPEVRVGELDASRRKLTWSSKISVNSALRPDFFVLSADSRANGTRFALSAFDRFQVGDGVRVYERGPDSWAEVSQVQHPKGERDVLFGHPMVLYGSDLLVFELPGAPTQSANIHRYHQILGGWRRSTVPFAPLASTLWWHLAMSPAGDFLLVTTEQAPGRYAVDFYSRSGEGRLAWVKSVELPRRPAALAVLSNRVIVGLTEPADDGSNLLIMTQESSGWRITGRGTLPPGAPPLISAMAATAGRVAVLRGELWLVSASGKTTHRLTAPGGVTGPLASCGASLLAASGNELVLFELDKLK